MKKETYCCNLCGDQVYVTIRGESDAVGLVRMAEAEKGYWIKLVPIDGSHFHLCGWCWTALQNTFRVKST